MIHSTVFICMLSGVAASQSMNACTEDVIPELLALQSPSVLGHCLYQLSRRRAIAHRMISDRYPVPRLQCSRLPAIAQQTADGGQLEAQGLLGFTLVQHDQLEPRVRTTPLKFLYRGGRAEALVGIEHRK